MKWTMKVKKLFVAFMLCEIKTKQTTKQNFLLTQSQLQVVNYNQT